MNKRPKEIQKAVGNILDVLLPKRPDMYEIEVTENEIKRLALDAALFKFAYVIMEQSLGLTKNVMMDTIQEVTKKSKIKTYGG